MNRIIHVAALHGIVVNVLQLLQEHFIILDLLRLAAFLPELVALIDFVAKLVVSKLFEKGIGPRSLK